MQIILLWPHLLKLSSYVLLLRFFVSIFVFHYIIVSLTVIAFVREMPETSSGWIFKRKSGIGCSLKKFDRYTFLMGVEFTSQYGTLASMVTVSHKYYETMMTLKRNTTVSSDWLNVVHNKTEMQS